MALYKTGLFGISEKFKPKMKIIS